MLEHVHTIKALNIRLATGQFLAAGVVKADLGFFFVLGFETASLVIVYERRKSIMGSLRFLSLGVVHKLRLQIFGLFLTPPLLLVDSFT